MTFTPGTTNINWPLYKALLGFYADKQSNSASQVQLREQRNAADYLDRFAVDSWRNWAASAPRRADVTSSVPYLPLSDQAITRVAAASWHSLALRNDGTVVVWGSYDLGQTNLPAGLTNVMVCGI